MKYKISIAKKNDPLFKEGFTVSPLKDYLKSKEDRGLKPLFFEKVRDKRSSRKVILKNVINTLKKNGWKIKGGSNGDS